MRRNREVDESEMTSMGCGASQGKHPYTGQSPGLASLAKSGAEGTPVVSELHSEPKYRV